jgi:hypothetical protein
MMNLSSRIGPAQTGAAQNGAAQNGAAQNGAAQNGATRNGAYLPRPLRPLALLAGSAVLLALAGCFGGGMSDGMQLTAEEAATGPPAEEGAIRFVLQTPAEGENMLIGTTTSTTSVPTTAYIARQKIHEHRHRPVVSNRIQPVIDPNRVNEHPPQSGETEQIRLVPLDGGNTIRRRAGAAAIVGEVTVLGVTQETIERASLTP